MLVGIETFNAGIINRQGNKKGRAIAKDLPLARTGSSDSHFAGTIGNGTTLFKGHTAGDLRKALEQRETEAQAGPLVSVPAILIGWIRGSLLRKAGWVECNFLPSQPVTLGRSSMIQTAETGRQ